MKALHITSLILPLFLLVNSCSQQAIEEEVIDYPESFTVHALRIDFLNEINPRGGEQWDEDGSGPDIFIKYYDENNRPHYSDTIVDYDFEPGLVIELPVPQTIHQDSTETSFSLEIRDWDILPTLPASVQSNDKVIRTSVPFYLPHYRFYRCNRDFYRIITNGYIWASLEVTCN